MPSAKSAHRQGPTKPRPQRNTRSVGAKLVLASLPSAAIVLLVVSAGALAQSAKGGAGGQPGQRLGAPTSTAATTTSAANSYSTAAQSPGSQVRQQQQQQQQTSYQRPSQPASPATKRRTQQQPVDAFREDRFQQQPQQQSQATTEDPLADSEPALYGSVAGSPGVDFPAYTQIPKTSFTCEGKGFDFGFYADEEAQCQVYHVCWSGRRESFLCGVGTVFNQAILACDYWHSVDCSKSSQFYNVNSELGKAGAEPGAGNQRTQQAQRPRTISPANLPNRSTVSNQYADDQQQQQRIPVPTSSGGFGEPLSQRRITQQQTFSPDDTQYDQSTTRTTTSSSLAPAYSTGAPATGSGGLVPQRTSVQQRPTTSGSYEQQQRIELPPVQSTKSSPRDQQPFSTTSPAVADAPQRPRFNMDFNQKVNSLIESPVRAPINKPAAPVKRPVVSVTQPPSAIKSASVPTAKRPLQQQQVSSGNFAQMAVVRAQQKSTAPKVAAKQPQYSQTQQRFEDVPQQQQQQQQFDSDLDEPQQQQQQNFDDSPVQTSTAPAIVQQRTYAGAQSRQSNNFVPQQMVIHSGGNSLDGSSAITTQYDTMTPVGQSHHNNQQQQQQLTGDLNQDSGYESALDDSQSGANDDFRSSGAKAAASQNQNWYIMRTI